MAEQSLDFLRKPHIWKNAFLPHILFPYFPISLFPLFPYFSSSIFFISPFCLLLPQSKLISPRNIIIDAKSGVSGAGEMQIILPSIPRRRRGGGGGTAHALPWLQRKKIILKMTKTCRSRSDSTFPHGSNDAMVTIKVMNTM